ncbi:hypothetical protein M3Y98_00223200 [Aphelenchoides besseyi]|nr:hypothetical protein M3Y98_00223200 [Aphelenchoides besseyi]KAI6200499.1 hypothetical protein M3Y96_00740700 [Aphelenchoides besseyi]
MSSILTFLGLCSLASTTMTLRCFHCSHTNIKSATKGIHDRIESSPEHCAVQNTCEGKWCVTSLSGNNVSFSCTDRAPVEYFWHEDQINSYCTAAYDDRSVAHATCWCRTHDFCLTNGTRTIDWIGGLVLSAIILLIQRL